MELILLTPQIISVLSSCNARALSHFLIPRIGSYNLHYPGQYQKNIVLQFLSALRQIKKKKTTTTTNQLFLKK